MDQIKRIETFKEVFGGIDGGKVLDLACGEGQFVEILIDSLKSWEEITGLDVSNIYISEARKKFNNNRRIRFVKGSAQKIPFLNESFNMVCLSKGLHHVKDPVLALEEMKRVLKTGGYLVINEMYSDGLSESQTSRKLYHHLRSEVDNYLGITHNYTFEKDEIICMVARLKLIDLNISEFIEDQKDPLNPGRIKEFSNKMDSWLEYIEDQEKHAYFLEKIRSLKSRFKLVGITNPPQLVIVGRKGKKGSPCEMQSNFAGKIISQGKAKAKEEWFRSRFRVCVGLGQSV